jgi:CDP-diacylglycerol--serine O-phosphatidyltransferase
MHIKNRGIYLLPNILTTFGLFAGFYSIILATQGRFLASSIAIFIAMLWDGLDGRVARLTNTSSEFGEQYDSMADLVSFGIAPAFLIYFYTTAYLSVSFGNFTYIAIFVYIAGASLRLARFNAQINTVDKSYFQGLPSPAAAALIAGFIWLIQSFDLSTIGSKLLAATLLITLIIAGLLMVSNIRYYSFKTINLKNKSSFKSLLILVLVIILILLHPEAVLFGFFVVYALSGIIWTLNKVHKKRQKKLLNQQK